MLYNYNIKFVKISKIPKICIKSNSNKLFKKLYIDNKIMSITFCKINVKHVKDNK